MGRWSSTALLAVTLVAGCGQRIPSAPAAPLRDAGPRGEILTSVSGGSGGASSAANAPPIAGGNVLALASGALAIAHPASDTLVIADPEGSVLATVELGDQVEPGRVVEDAAGLVHLVLRATGELVTIDPSDAIELERRAVCAAPRGLAYDADADVLYVACAGGELVSLPAQQGGPTLVADLGPDLRDVVVADGAIHVSRFRSAELITVARDGSVVEVRRPSVRTETDASGGTVRLSPEVAYRVRPMPRGGVAMLYQRAVAPNAAAPATGYYGSSTPSAAPFQGPDAIAIGPCETGMVQSAIAIFPPSGPPIESGPLAAPALAVDLAISADGQRFYVASAATADASTPAPAVRSFPRAALDDECLESDGAAVRDAAVAVEMLEDGRVASLARDAASLRVMTPHLARLRELDLDIAVRTSDGAALFHALTPSQLACASCHPEGGDDGHTWELAAGGGRRTQSLRGGLLATAPFHWAGDQPDMAHVMSLTFRERMGGTFSSSEVRALSSWLDTLPSVAGASDDDEVVRRGRYLFEHTAGCVACHSGDALTNNRNRDVGTGGAFQVPSLRGVRMRAPYFHDGCAASLDAVLDGACGTSGLHGHAGGLSDTHRAELLAYLRSL